MSALSREDEWLWGWDPTPGIVSVYAESDGRAYVWRRDLSSGQLTRDDVRFRAWLVLDSLEYLNHLGARFVPESRGKTGNFVTWRELKGEGALRFLVRANDGRALASEVLRGASRHFGRHVARLSELSENVIALAPEDQYLVASGRTYFGNMAFDDLRRMQFDLETTGLDPAVDRIFMVAIRSHLGEEVLEINRDGDAGEADLIRRLAHRIAELDPDVIENHNLHGFDLPFIARRVRTLGITIELGRLRGYGMRQRPAARGVAMEGSRGTAPDLARRGRYTVPGRELIDTMDAIRRYDFATRELDGHGLKSVAKHFGLASEQREYVPGARIHEVWLKDPERVRRYALDDVREVDGIARLLGGSAFALARMAPRRYERLADAGAATGVIDPLLVRAYLRSASALPARESGDGTQHTGASLFLFATGMARRVVKADVASLYPSLMRQYRIGPRRDRLGVLLALVDRLVEQRLAAKSRARAAPAGSAQRHTDEALSAAMKLVVNSAYGYLGAVGLTRFADVHAANEVTRHGREVLALLCRELARRGGTLLEADTDGVYFAAPDHWTESDERRVVSEVAELLPPLVRLEFEGRYLAMLSHEPKNYALLYSDGKVVLRGVAFRSSRAEPFGERFLRDAVGRLLTGDVTAVREAYVAMHLALARREVPTALVAAKVRLTKSPEQYLATRGQRRELPYEAMLAGGVENWPVGKRIRVYRSIGGKAALWTDSDESDPSTATDRRDYDVDYYTRVLRDTYASRLARAFEPQVYASLVSDPEQPSLFDNGLDDAQPVLTVRMDPP